MQLHDPPQQRLGGALDSGGLADPVQQRQSLELGRRQLQDFEAEPFRFLDRALGMPPRRALDQWPQRLGGLGRRQQRQVELAAARQSEPAAARAEA